MNYTSLLIQKYCVLYCIHYRRNSMQSTKEHQYEQKNNEFVYETVIDHYIISFIDCVFKTDDIGWNRYFDETVMIIGDKK